MRNIQTAIGPQTADATDYAFMDYLDNLVDELPGGYSFGMLLFKGDPIAYRTARDEWLAENTTDENDEA